MRILYNPNNYFFICWWKIFIFHNFTSACLQKKHDLRCFWIIERKKIRGGAKILVIKMYFQLHYYFLFQNKENGSKYSNPQVQKMNVFISVTGKNRARKNRDCSGEEHSCWSTSRGTLLGTNPMNFQFIHVPPSNAIHHFVEISSTKSNRFS